MSRRNRYRLKRTLLFYDKNGHPIRVGDIVKEQITPATCCYGIVMSDRGLCARIIPQSGDIATFNSPEGSTYIVYHDAEGDKIYTYAIVTAAFYCHYYCNKYTYIDTISNDQLKTIKHNFKLEFGIPDEGSINFAVQRRLYKEVLKENRELRESYNAMKTKLEALEKETMHRAAIPLNDSTIDSDNVLNNEEQLFSILKNIQDIQENIELSLRYISKEVSRLNTPTEPTNKNKNKLADVLF